MPPRQVVRPASGKSLASGKIRKESLVENDPKFVLDR